MALLPDLHVNLDRPTIQHIYQLFLPIVPGGTLVIGILAAHPNYLKQLATATGVGYYSLVATTVFIAYSAGVMLYAFGVHFGLLLSTFVGVVFDRNQKLRPFRENLSISQNHVWRTVADAFLGKQLAPAPPTLPGSDGLFTNATHFPSVPVPPIVQQYDTDWNDWYNVLQDYVLRSMPALAPEVYFLFTIAQATGWAVIITSLHAHIVRNHLLSFVVIAFVVSATALVQFGSNFFYRRYDRLAATDLVARLLTEVRARENADRLASVRPTAPPQ